MNLYTDFDPKVCAWARELVADGLVPPGEVWERDIKDIKPEELEPFIQCHFFCGILGWPYALRLAGIPDDLPLWTASLPCQPFSCAGKQKGEQDERHLFPHFLKLVQAVRPPRIYGEQVPGAVRMGWLDGVQDALEACGYSTGATILPACSVGAPHLRQRLFWVADFGNDGRVADGEGRGLQPLPEAEGETRGEGDKQTLSPELRRPHGGLADGDSA